MYLKGADRFRLIALRCRTLQHFILGWEGLHDRSRGEVRYMFAIVVSGVRISILRCKMAEKENMMLRQPKLSLQQRVHRDVQGNVGIM